jgi:hypothetical protein
MLLYLAASNDFILFVLFAYLAELQLLYDATTFLWLIFEFINGLFVFFHLPSSVLYFLSGPYILSIDYLLQFLFLLSHLPNLLL